MVFVKVVLLTFAVSNIVDETKAVAIVTAIEGDVRIFRVSTMEIVAANLEHGLFVGDSVITGSGSGVTMLYNNGKISAIGSETGVKITEVPGDTTDRGKSVLESNTPEVTTTLSPLFAFSSTGEKVGMKILVRGEEDSTALVVYAPGNTALIEGKPDFVWGRFRNARSYIVTIQRMGNIIWEKLTPDTVMLYPKEEPELVPGTYLFKITALGESKDTLISAERIIKILKSESKEEIVNALNYIISQNPDSFTLHFLSARIYEEKGVILNAIQEYEQILKIKPRALEIHKFLSLLYNKLGLPQFGNKYFDNYERLINNKK